MLNDGLEERWAQGQELWVQKPGHEHLQQLKVSWDWTCHGHESYFIHRFEIYHIYIYIIHIWSCVHVDIISGVLVIVFGALVPCHWRQHPAVRTRADPLPWPLHLPWSFYPLCRHRCGRRSSEEMVLPLGYQTTGAYFDGNSYGKSPPLLGKSTINGPFSIAIMLVYQRVNRWILLSNTAIYCWFTH